MNDIELAKSNTEKVLKNKYQNEKSLVLTKKFVLDISASSLQTIINQFCSLLIFYILSKYFDKNIFGELSWCLAVLMISFSILSCGIDQMIVQRTAAGYHADASQKIYLFHVLLTGISFVALLFLATNIFKENSGKLNLLFFLSIGQLFTYITSPFKQIANGKEDFRSLLIMSTCSSVIKVIALATLAFSNKITISAFISIYVLASFIELIVCVIINKQNLFTEKRIAIKKKDYVHLIKESLPQLGVVIFNSAVARFDWVMLGILSTTVILADYSFAYKAFELSTLPLLIIGPVLLPKITRWFAKNNEGINERKKHLLFLARAEIMFSCFLALLLNLLWSPVIDAITDNKYGAVNSFTILILSSAVPFLYVNNILWSVNFAQRKMKLIFYITTATFILICTGDIFLIPFSHGEGAAIAYLTAIVTQCFLFINRTAFEGKNKIWNYLILYFSCAIFGGISATHITSNLLFQLIIASAVYWILVIICKYAFLKDYQSSKRIAWK